MSDWTAGATECLERWLDEMVSSVPADTDPGEVREDLRAHVLLDVEAACLSPVTADDVQRITAKLGSPPRQAAPRALAAANPPAVPRRDPRSTTPTEEKPRAGLVVVGGVVLPAAALLIESQLHTWKQTFLDPIPTPWHVAAIFAVAIINLACVFLTPAALARRRGLWGTLNGFAIGVPLVYAIIFLPGLPIALIGLIVLLGILPLSPYLAVLAGIRARSWITQGARLPRVLGLPPTLLGLLAAFLLLLLPEVHGILTTGWIAKAASSDTAESAAAVRLLRKFGDERTMAAAARGETRFRNRASLLPFGLLARRTAGADAAARVWYRVTGERSPGWTDAGDDEFFVSSGFAAGSEIDLTASRLDGVVDAPGSNVYLQWTLTFRNGARGQGEAVTDLLLPPGAVGASRATLWVDGQEREAAFAGRRQAEEAYERVVSYRRDPLLVTASGNGRVRLRGFPVVREKDFQLRIGITAPLVLESPVRGTIVLPRIVDRDFSLAPGVRHAVWIESRAPLREAPAFTIEQASGGGWTARAQIDDTQIGLEASTLAVERTNTEAILARDQLTPSDHKVVVQKIAGVTPVKPDRVVLVVDGGGAMRDHVRQLAEAVASIPEGFDLGLVWGGDEIVDLGGGCHPSTRRSVHELSEKLARQEAAGGTDAVAALARGFDLASESPRSAVIWAHAEVRRTLSPAVELVQAIERRPESPRLYDFALSPGADAAAEALPPQRIQRIARLGDPASDLARLLEWWTGARPKFVYQRERVPFADAPPGAVEATAHVGRLWASDFIDRISFPVRADRQEEAIALARTFQLVTPVSGAVVLETAEQFQANGLQPVDPSSVPEVPVPSVPEPHEWALLAVAAVLLLGLAFRRRRAQRFA